MLCTDLFGKQAKDESGTYFFDSARASWTSMFRLFLGEGWHDIMWAASDGTTVAARFVFFGITFVMTILVSELVVGIVIQLYQELENVPTVRLYHYLEPVYRNHEEADRDQVLEDLRKLNWRLFDIHNMIDEARAS